MLRHAPGADRRRGLRQARGMCPLAARGGAALMPPTRTMRAQAEAPAWSGPSERPRRDRQVPANAAAASHLTQTRNVRARCPSTSRLDGAPLTPAWSAHSGAGCGANLITAARCGHRGAWMAERGDGARRPEVEPGHGCPSGGLQVSRGRSRMPAGRCELSGARHRLAHRALELLTHALLHCIGLVRSALQLLRRSLLVQR
jgi:hypothetical protein